MSDFQKVENPQTALEAYVSAVQALTGKEPVTFALQEQERHLTSSCCSWAHFVRASIDTVSVTKEALLELADKCHVNLGYCSYNDHEFVLTPKGDYRVTGFGLYYDADTRQNRLNVYYALSVVIHTGDSAMLLKVTPTDPVNDNSQRYRIVWTPEAVTAVTFKDNFCKSFLDLAELQYDLLDDVEDHIDLPPAVLGDMCRDLTVHGTSTVSCAPRLTEERVDRMEKALAESSPLADMCDRIKEMLLEKNRKYGDSALHPVRVFSKADPLEQLKVRMDDKLSRLRNQQPDEDEDVVLDLVGYLILYLVARQEAQIAKQANHEV